MRPERWRLAIGALNTAALGAYVLWMAVFNQDRLFHSQESILLWLPVLPISVVYILLARGRPAERERGARPPQRTD